MESDDAGSEDEHSMVEPEDIGMIPEIRPKKMTRRYMKPSEKDEIYKLVQNAPKGPQKEKYQFAQRKFVEDHYPENAKQCIESGSWKECIIAIGVIKGICDERLWDTHEKSHGIIQMGSKRRRTNNARVEIDNNLALTKINIEEQQRLWNEAKVIKNAEDELKLTIRRTPKVVVQYENTVKEKLQDEVPKESPVVVVPEENHDCTGYNQRKTGSRKDCRFCVGYDEYDGEIWEVELKIDRITDEIYDKETKLLKYRSILRKDSTKKKTRSVQWFNGEIAWKKEPELAAPITFFDTNRLAAHYTVSSVQYFERDHARIFENADNNADIRMMRKESRYQSNFEKFMGFYRPKTIIRDISVGIADFTCYLCRSEFDFDYTKGYRKRSDQYCTICFAEVKKFYLRLRKRRYELSVKNKNHKINTIRELSQHNLFRPMLKDIKLPVTRLIREVTTQ